MNTKFKAKMLLNLLMICSVFFNANGFLIVHAMKRATESPVPPVPFVKRFCQDMPQQQVEIPGSSERAALCEKWFELLDKGTIPELEGFLARHNNECLKWKSDRGQLALHHVISRGNVKKAELLLRKGADVNAIDGFGRTPLMCAVQAYEFGFAEPIVGHEMLNLVCKYNPDGNIKCAGGNTPLHIMVMAGDIDLYYRFVKEMHCETSIKNDQGLTPCALGRSLRRWRPM